MIFNGNFAVFSIFHQFSMFFNGKHASFSLLVYLPFNLMGSWHFVNFPCYSMGFWGLRSLGGETDRRTDGRTYGNSPLCPTGHRPFGVAAQKGSKSKDDYTYNSKNNRSRICHNRTIKNRNCNEKRKQLRQHYHNLVKTMTDWTALQRGHMRVERLWHFPSNSLVAGSVLYPAYTKPIAQNQTHNHFHRYRINHPL